MNICTDELLLRVVPPARIASVTWLSRDASASNVSQLAQMVAVNHGSAEEVIPSAPDLVLAGQYTAPAATALLKHTGFHVETFAIPRDVSSAIEQIRAFGRLVDAGPEAAALAARIERDTISASQPANLRRPRAMVLNPNGVTVGAGTLPDALMKLAGLDNIAERLELGGYDQVPLEKIASLDVEVLIVSGATHGAPSLATEVLHHPVLEKLATRMIIVEIPGRLWGCAGPGLADAVARLRAAADAARARAGEDLH